MTLRLITGYQAVIDQIAVVWQMLLAQAFRQWLLAVG